MEPDPMFPAFTTKHYMTNLNRVAYYEYYAVLHKKQTNKQTIKFVLGFTNTCCMLFILSNVLESCNMLFYVFIGGEEGPCFGWEFS